MPAKIYKDFEIDMAPLNREESFGGVEHYGIMFHDRRKNLTRIGWIPKELYDMLPDKKQHQSPPAPPETRKVVTIPTLTHFVVEFLRADGHVAHTEKLDKAEHTYSTAKTWAEVHCTQEGYDDWRVK